MDDWEDYWINDGGNNWYDDYYAPKKENTCQHEWIKILLITSTVENCKHCDIKKEEWEKNK